jgi:nicotinamide mononucleotide adenylyltransferase
MANDFKYPFQYKFWQDLVALLFESKGATVIPPEGFSASEWEA